METLNCLRLLHIISSNHLLLIWSFPNPNKFIHVGRDTKDLSRNDVKRGHCEEGLLRFFLEEYIVHAIYIFPPQTPWQEKFA